LTEEPFSAFSTALKDSSTTVALCKKIVKKYITTKTHSEKLKDKHQIQ